MKRASKSISVALGFLLLGVSVYVLRFAAPVEAGTGRAADTEEQAQLALNIIRVINTAEVVNCRTRDEEIDPKEKFRMWNDLFNAPCFKQAQSHYSGARFSQVSELSFRPEPEIVSGLELRLVISPDGNHYNVWLGQKKDVNCGFAFFSDERGMIYVGKVIGCDPQGILGKP